MVRLVFRPYTHVRRTICTSVSLRTSTKVSPGFILHKHSSPSFGSQHTCSSEECSPGGSQTADHATKCMIQSISLRTRVYNSNTRTYVRLLGPCFKTGRMKPFRQRPGGKATTRNLPTKHRSTKAPTLGKQGHAAGASHAEDSPIKSSDQGHSFTRG